MELSDVDIHSPTSLLNRAYEILLMQGRPEREAVYEAYKVVMNAKGKETPQICTCWPQ